MDISAPANEQATTVATPVDETPLTQKSSVPSTSQQPKRASRRNNDKQTLSEDGEAPRWMQEYCTSATKLIRSLGDIPVTESRHPLDAAAVSYTVGERKALRNQLGDLLISADFQNNPKHSNVMYVCHHHADETFRTKTLVVAPFCVQFVWSNKQHCVKAKTFLPRDPVSIDKTFFKNFSIEDHYKRLNKSSVKHEVKPQVKHNTKSASSKVNTQNSKVNNNKVRPQKSSSNDDYHRGFKDGINKVLSIISQSQDMSIENLRNKLQGFIELSEL